MHVHVPDWMRPFVNPLNRSLEFTYPFKRLFYRVWFAPLYWIRNYNRRDCVYYVPDYMNGIGTKIRPFLGYTVLIEEGAQPSLAWWKHLKRYNSVRTNRS